MNKKTHFLWKNLSLLLVLCLLLTALPGGPARAEEDAVTAKLKEARLLVNKGQGLAAKELLENAAKELDDPRLETALMRLEKGQWKNVEQIIYRSDGSVNYSFRYEYDAGGKRSRSQTLSAEGKVQSEELFEFNGENLRIGGKIYDGEGRLTSWAEFELNETGDLVRQVTYSESGVVSMYEYFYNEYGDAELIIRYNGLGEEASRTEYTFDEYGIFTGMTNTSPDGRSVAFPFDNSYEIDPDGQTLLIRCIHHSSGLTAADYVMRFIPLQ